MRYVFVNNEEEIIVYSIMTSVLYTWHLDLTESCTVNYNSTFT